MSTNNTPSGDSFIPQNSGEPTQRIERQEAQVNETTANTTANETTAPLNSPLLNRLNAAESTAQGSTAQMPPVPPAPAAQPSPAAPAAPAAPVYAQQAAQHPQARHPQYVNSSAEQSYANVGHGTPQSAYFAQQAAAQQAAAQQAQAHAQSQQAQAQHAQAQRAQQAYAGAQPQAQAPAKRRMMAPIAVTAVAAAVLASLGTAAVTGQFGGDSSSVANSSAFGSIGQKGDSSVTVPVTSSTVTNPDWQAVSSAVAPSVVAIAVTTADGGGEGSGVIIDGEGHILTNDHVVSGAVNDTVQVTLYDGRIYEAKITGLDPATDLAVVKLVDPPSDLKSAVFADSTKVVVGEPVMAMGNPLGLSNTATTGIVSAINRPVSTATTTADQTAVVTNAIQIDAAINPGNSGGPLFNASGEVIGITSSIASLSSGSGQSGSIGLGFAIPANLAQNIGSQLIGSGTAEHAFLGVSLADGTGTADGTTRQGAVVKSVSTGSPAEKAGLKVDDVIVAIDGEAVTGAESLTGFVRALPADTEVTLTVVRDGKALDVKATLTAKVEDTTSNSDGSSGSSGSGQSGSGQGGSGQGGSGTLPGSDDPSGIPDLGQLFPGQQG